MENEQHQQYEYARKRIKQKKTLYLHFVLLIIGSLFMFTANVLLHFGEPTHWYIWAVTVWVFLFILHFVKVFISDRFMNKNWEREQIDKLVAKQQDRVTQLHTKADDNLPKG